MTTTLQDSQLGSVLDRLAEANGAFQRRYSGERPDRQAIHTVYGGAQLFKRTTTVKLGQLALQSLEAFAPDVKSFGEAFGLTDEISARVYPRVADKLKREAVEDFRIDFEDGFGARPDAEEDEVAVRAGEEVAAGMEEGTLPPFIGIRIKPLTEEFKRRAFRTLDMFLTAVFAKSDKQLPAGFVITLPKVTVPEQVKALADVLDIFEQAHGLTPKSLRVEIMIETTQSILSPQGHSLLPGFVTAGRGRVDGAHFGTYDYTASCNITAAHQEMDHPACDFARHMMKVAYSGMPLSLSDGATNVMPVAPHRGDNLSAAQQAENRDVVHRAWRLAFDHTRHSLRNGYYQGWDLHPAQFVARYAACYSFFLEGLDAATDRLSSFIDKAAQATLLGDVFDDAATGQGLLNYFLRALNCGAITMAEVQASGLTLEEIRSRSFMQIMKNRRGD